MSMKESPKERILNVAFNLFYKEGIRAVGIDRIIADSGVAKASFYRNFPTKDHLIVAYLERRSEVRLEAIEKVKKQFPDSPKQQLYTLLEELVERMKSPHYRGCSFMNAIVEFPDEEHPGHQAAMVSRHKTWKQVEDIVRQAGARDPVQLTYQLQLLKEGAMMGAYMDKDAYHPDYFLDACKMLIEGRLP